MTNEDLEKKADEIINDMLELGEYSRNFTRDIMPIELQNKIRSKLEEKGYRVEIMAPQPHYIDISFCEIVDETTDDEVAW